MKNTLTFYFKILFLNSLLFLGLVLVNPLPAQQPEFANPVINHFGLSAPVGSVDTFIRVKLVDIDHDDILEAFVNIAEDDDPFYPGRDFHFYENNGSNENPDFVFMDSYPFGIPNNTLNWMWQFVDINGDGKEDFVTSGFIHNNPVSILMNIGSNDVPNFEGPFVENPYGITLPVSDSGEGLLDAVAPTFVDIDNDGDFDLFYSGVFIPIAVEDEAFYFSRNIGDATTPLYSAPEKNPFGLTFPQGATFHWEGFEDVDCDGDFDMYMNIPGVFDRFYENTGTPEDPVFSSGELAQFDGFFPMIGSFVDIGGDGDLDLLCGSISTGVMYYENLTSTNFIIDSISEDGLTYTFNTDFSNNATSWLWDFGDGNTSDEENPVYTFPDYGQYEVCLTADGDLNCQNTSCQLIDVVSSVKDLQLDATLKLYPNPTSDFLTLELVSEEHLDRVEIAIFNMVGQKITSHSIQSFNNNLQKTISLKGLPSGLYLLKASSKDKFLTHKFLKL